MTFPKVSTFSALFQTEKGNPFNPLSQNKISGQTITKNDGKDDPVIERPSVSLTGKPADQAIGEHLTRQALERIKSKYGLDDADINLEIEYVKNRKGGDFIDDLKFGKTNIENPDSLTDKQLADLIAKGHKNVNFGIHQSTVERMIERREIVKFMAQRDEMNIPISDGEFAELEQNGYSREDLKNLRDAKYMTYLGERSRVRKEVENNWNQINDNLRQKMLDRELAELQKRPIEDFYDEGNEKIKPEAELRRVANERINGLLDGRTPFEYFRQQQQTAAREDRLSKMNNLDYGINFGKNAINGVYYGIGELFKGAGFLERYGTPNGIISQSNISDTTSYKIGDWIQKNVQAPTDSDLDQTILGGQLPHTVGRVLPMVVGGWATGAPKATAAVFSALSTGGTIYDEAKRYGASESDAQKAALLTGGFAGVTGVLGYGKTLETLNKGAGAATWKAIFSEAVKDGTRNALVEGGQTVFENGVAKNLYDKDRAYLHNVEQRMLAAGITGATLKGGLEIIAKVRMGRNPQVLAETQKILKVKAESESLTPKQIELKNSGNAKRAELEAKLNKSNLNSSKIEPNQKSDLGGRIEEITAPASGKSVKVYTDGKTLVPVDKIEKYIRGKVDVDVQAVMKELRNLKQLRNLQRKLFDANPENIVRLEHLEKMKHNFERSDDMRKTLESVGLLDTPNNNRIIADHLLKIGKNVTSDNRLNFPSLIEGPKGKIKLLSTWTIIDEKPYLSTIKLIPISK